MDIKKLCVFCGSSIGVAPEYTEAARSLGVCLARHHIVLIYGGADVGLMGHVANACLEEGGQVVGVMPRHLVEMEVAHDHLTELITVETMHQRKERMSQLADGFIVMPGGIGTLEETLEMFTWAQLGLHAKPIAFLNTLGFFDPFFTLLRHMVSQGFLSAAHVDLLYRENDPAGLLQKLFLHTPVIIDKWFDREKNKAF